MAQQVKNLLARQEMQQTWVWSLGQEDPLQEEIGNYSRIPVWKTPWTEEPGKLQYKVSWRVDTAEQLSMYTHWDFK